MCKSAPALAPLLALGLLSTTALADEASVARAFVADHAQGVVTVIDLESASQLTRFEISGPARLYTNPGQDTVFAVQRDQGSVAAIDTGIALSDHGGHTDIRIGDPALRPGVLEGPEPTHFVNHGGLTATFFDGDGSAAIVSESAFAQSGDLPVRILETGEAHHGVAAAIGRQVVISRPHPEDPSNLPVGIDLIEFDGTSVGDLHQCPELHGEAVSGNLLALACETGLLLVRQSAQGAQISHLPYADHLPDGKATTILGGRAMQYFLGNWGSDAVVVIDPSEPDAMTHVALPTRRVDFAIDPVRPQFAYIFTEDGHLRRLNVLSGELTGSLALTDPYSMDGHWSDPRPRLGVAADQILVTDPLAGVLHRVDAVAFEPIDTIEIEGTPFALATAFGSGVVH